MAVRDAKFADIPAMVDLLQQQFRKSHYAREGTVRVDEKQAKGLLVQAIQRHGGKNGGSCFVQVSEHEGMIVGLIVATLDRVYAIGDRLRATDLFWVANANVPARDPEKLMRNMVQWAWSNPHVIEVVCGTTKVVSGNARRAGRILERIGMREYGLIYRMGKES